jgi:hypothetical protein
MSEPKNGFTAKPCTFNGASGYILRQYVNSVLRVEQFVNDLPEFCKAAGIPLDSIQII